MTKAALNGRYTIWGWSVDDGSDAGVPGNAPLSHVSPWAYRLDRQGNPAWPGRAVAATYGGAQVMPTVINDGFSASVARRLLGSGRTRTRAAEAVADLCSRRGYQGVTIAFGNLPERCGPGFSAFVEELAWLLHGDQRTLAVMVPPAGAADSGSFDRQLLGVYADYFIMSTFNYAALEDGGNTGMAVFNDDATGLESRLGETILDVPPRKIVPALPASPQLAQQAAVVSRLDLGGVAVWHAGIMSPDLWAQLERVLQAGEN